MLIDSHLHLDDARFNNLQSAVKFVSDELKNAKIEKGIVLHLLAQKWDVKEVSSCIQDYDNIDCFVNVDPFQKNSKVMLEDSILKLGFKGLKLHPRLQNFLTNQKEVVSLVNFASKLKIPVLIDAFPDGDYLQMGIKSSDYFDLAKKCPRTNIIIAHFGGHHCIDFMMMAKRTKNVYFDISFSLLYYMNSPVVNNLIYCMKSMNFNRIFYGSDYPDRGIKETLEQSINIFKKNHVDQINIDKLLFKNWKSFYGG